MLVISNTSPLLNLSIIDHLDAELIYAACSAHGSTRINTDQKRKKPV